MNSTTNLVTSWSRSCGHAAVISVLTLLCMAGCTERTGLLSAGGGAGGEPDATGGWVAAGTGGNGGVSARGGSVATGGNRGSGGVSANGGMIPMAGGGYRVAGGIPAVGGAGAAIANSGGVRISAGGATPVRGGSPAGGVPAAGGSSRMGGSPATGGTVAVGTPAILPDGYVTLHTGTVVMAGHVSSYESGSGSSITLTYSSNSFCASGTVAADSTYSSWAGAGFNVNQAESGASGSSNSLVLTGSSVSVTYVNRSGSSLEFQMYDGSNYWCAYLPASASSTTATLPFSQLNTQCWNGLGKVFVSGTPITAVQLVVAGSAFSPTPFDFCFQGMTVQ
jgi:hypothetical protein